MFKKEYLFIFVILGLSIVYALLSFLVFLSRGKLTKIIKKKIIIGTMIVTFSTILTIGQVSCIPPFATCYDPIPPPDCYAPPPEITPEPE